VNAQSTPRGLQSENENPAVRRGLAVSMQLRLALTTVLATLAALVLAALARVLGLLARLLLAATLLLTGLLLAALLVLRILVLL
jgi:hypothetical protein